MLSVFGGSRTVAGSTHSQRGSTSQQIPAVDHPNGNDRHNIQDHDHPRQLLSAEKSSRPHFLWNLFCWKIGCKEMSYVWHQSYSKERSPVFLHIYPLLSALFQAPPASATVHGWQAKKTKTAGHPRVSDHSQKLFSQQSYEKRPKLNCPRVTQFTPWKLPCCQAFSCSELHLAPYMKFPLPQRSLALGKSRSAWVIWQLHGTLPWQRKDFRLLLSFQAACKWA